MCIKLEVYSYNYFNSVKTGFPKGPPNVSKNYKRKISLVSMVDNISPIKDKITNIYSFTISVNNNRIVIYLIFELFPIMFVG